MGESRKIIFCLCLMLVCAGCAAGIDTDRGGRGKFYIVGMGTAPYGYDTSGVILTMADWTGRRDVNEKLMATGSTMVFYTMLFDYPKVFLQLQRHYPADTPVAVVNNAGDRDNQRVIRSTVGRFLQDVDYRNLLAERHILLVGKFLKVGQAREDFVPHIERGRTK